MPIAETRNAHAAPSRRGSGSRTLVVAAMGGAIGFGIVALMSGLLALWQGSIAGRSPLAGSAREGENLYGNYLAGRFARSENDVAAAATYYRRALDQDPGNQSILEQSFLLEVSTGDWDEAVSLAEAIQKNDPGLGLAALVLGLEAFDNGRWDEAERHFVRSGQGSLAAEPISVMLRAWLRLARGDGAAGLTVLAEPSRAEWVRAYQAYHGALIASLANMDTRARSAFTGLLAGNTVALRAVMANAQFLSQRGDQAAARASLTTEAATRMRHPSLVALREALKGAAPQPLLVASAREGMAEVLYGLGTLLSQEGLTADAKIYLQLSLRLRPEFDFALVSLGGLYERIKTPALALETYARVPETSPLWPDAQTRKAFALNTLERVEDAKALLLSLADARAKAGDGDAYDALGDIMRGHKRYDEAVDYYSRAIATIGTVERHHWPHFYARGMSYERLKKWPEAEADLLKALDLEPQQPYVLNYLGYSWIDQNINLARAMEMIRKAVDLRPNDGYIVDSLGWAYYRLGNFPEAVKHLERAVELRPQDATINDHLGDAYWRVGRTAEARYQWSQALGLEPEPDELPKIRAKLDHGLDGAPAIAARAEGVTDTAKQGRAADDGSAAIKPQ